MPSAAIERPTHLGFYGPDMADAAILSQYLDGKAAETFATDEAQRMAETQVIDAIDENLPDSEDEAEWNWEALAKMANVRWGLNLRDRELKKVGRDHVAELLIEKARESIAKIDLSEGAPMLEEDFGLRTTLAWVKYKFGFDLDIEEIRGRELPEITRSLVVELADS